MLSSINQLLSTNSDTQELVFKMLPKALGTVPFHQNTSCITRLFADHFPFHLAVHEVSAVAAPPKEYTQLHIHEDEDEVNIILSNDLLVYKIQLGNDEYCVSNNASIWIPKGMPHSANVLKGAGYFITMKFQSNIS